MTVTELRSLGVRHRCELALYSSVIVYMSVKTVRVDPRTEWHMAVAMGAVSRH